MCAAEKKGEPLGRLLALKSPLLFRGRGRIISASTARRVTGAARPERVVRVREIANCHDECLSSVWLRRFGVLLDVSYAPTAP